MWKYFYHLTHRYFYHLTHQRKYFYHITHHQNLSGILEHGILSRSDAHSRRLTNTDISDPAVQNRRDRREPIFHRSIQDYAPLYINPKNPMLSRRRNIQDELVILKVSPDVLKRPEVLFTDGNAASSKTSFGLDWSVVEPSQPVLQAKYWIDFQDGRRKRCAELLVHPLVEPHHIVGAICRGLPLASQLRKLCPFPITVDASIFF